MALKGRAGSRPALGTKHKGGLVKSIRDRFWAKVAVLDNSVCWEWMAAKSDGYGVFNKGNRQHKSHRISYEMNNGPIAHGMIVMHKCHNKGCVNPSHLVLGTSQENSQDVDFAKITKDQVLEIRSKYSREEMYYKILAEEYGVSVSNIASIVQGGIWSNIGGPISERVAPPRRAILSVDQKIAIRKKYADGETMDRLGVLYDVPKSTIWYTVRKWKPPD